MSSPPADFASISEILRGIAAEPSRTPEQSNALRVAAFALLFAISKHRAEFGRFIEEMESPLTPEEKAKLKEIGLE